MSETASLISSFESRDPFTSSALPHGCRVAVQNRFDGSWCDGFEVVASERVDGVLHYRVRRLSDGWLLPCDFTEDQLAPGHRHRR